MVGSVDAFTERQETGYGLILTLGGLVVSGTLIPDWQWFEDVERAARDAWVASGGDPEAEQAGIPGLVSAMGRDTLVNKRDEYLAARDAMQGLSDRYQRLLNESERASYVHLREARVFSPGDPPLPGNGMYWRGRLSEVSGWSFGLLGAGTPPEEEAGYA
jgi:hypothetical protein